MADAELLKLDLPAQFLEMFGQQFLLGRHAGRAAPPRPDRTELLEVFVGPRAVEGDILQLQRRGGSHGVAVPAAVAKQEPRRYRQAAGQHNRGHEERPSGKSWAGRFRSIVFHSSIFDGLRRRHKCIFSSCPRPPGSAILPRTRRRTEFIPFRTVLNGMNSVLRRTER